MDAKLAEWAITGTAYLVAAVVGWSILQTPIYEVSARVRVERQEAVGAVVDAAHSRPVVEEAIRRSGLKVSKAEFLENLMVERAPKGRIRLTYKDTDINRAVRAADTVARGSAERVLGTGVTVEKRAAVVYEKAGGSFDPVSPRPLRNGLIALVVGLVLSGAFIAGRSLLRRH